jgi:Family of unknown function (DUF5338)
VQKVVFLRIYVYGGLLMLRTARANFLALRVEVQRELDNGWTMQACYTTHAGALGMSYEQFRRYVRRFLPEAYARVRHVRAEEAVSPPPKECPAPLPSASPTVSGEKSDVERQPASGPEPDNFRHSHVPRPGELDELLGPDWKKRRR